ncbi:YlbF family regulator [Spirochaetota bacterium]
MMFEEHERIIELAKKLSSLIKEHEISKKYEESCVKMKSDYKSQELFQKLIMIGSDISEKLKMGREITYESQSEMKLIQKELEESTLVKNHILIQKEYLNFFQTVLDRIKNPTENSES